MTFFVAVDGRADRVLSVMETVTDEGAALAETMDACPGRACGWAVVAAAPRGARGGVLFAAQSFCLPLSFWLSFLAVFFGCLFCCLFGYLFGYLFCCFFFLCFWVIFFWLSFLAVVLVVFFGVFFGCLFGGIFG